MVISKNFVIISNDAEVLWWSSPNYLVNQFRQARETSVSSFFLFQVKSPSNFGFQRMFNQSKMISKLSNRSFTTIFLIEDSLPAESIRRVRKLHTENFGKFAPNPRTESHLVRFGFLPAVQGLMFVAIGLMGNLKFMNKSEHFLNICSDFYQVSCPLPHANSLAECSSLHRRCAYF